MILQQILLTVDINQIIIKLDEVNYFVSWIRYEKLFIFHYNLSTLQIHFLGGKLNILLLQLSS